VFIADGKANMPAPNKDLKNISPAFLDVVVVSEAAIQRPLQVGRGNNRIEWFPKKIRVLWLWEELQVYFGMRYTFCCTTYCM